LTRGKVLLIGLAVLLLGGIGQVGFQAAGFEGFSAGIAAEALLVVIVVVWTSSYLFRVVTGQMTYMNQRRRYREVYDKEEAEALQARYDALSEEEQQELLRKIGADASVPTDGEAPVDS
jgi:predicted metalloprotease